MPEHLTQQSAVVEHKMTDVCLLVQGENVVVLAYGASATGKSYTLQARKAVAAGTPNTTAAGICGNDSRAGRRWTR